jgi:hypothetical protein
VIPLNEFHLRRLVRDYLAYYHQDRTHIGLDRRLRPAAPRNHPVMDKLRSCQNLEWVACIIDIPCRRRRDH